MTPSQTLTNALAKTKGPLTKRYEKTVTAILALAEKYRRDGEDFSFEAHPELDSEVNRLLIELSDANLDDAKDRARRLLDNLEWDNYFDESWEYASGEREGDTAIVRLDMAATHLKELLALWIAVAFANNYTMSQISAQVTSYWGNPQLSPLWRGMRTNPLKWGRGYTRNLADATAGIISWVVSGAYHHAELESFKKDGATGYYIKRGSNYDCPLCDSFCGIVYPLDEQYLPIHENCMCIAVPVFGQ